MSTKKSKTEPKVRLVMVKVIRGFNCGGPNDRPLVIGDTIEVSDSVAQVLLRRGFEKQGPKKVPPVPVKTAPVSKE
ncbi:MAG: hypothetical protein JKY94_16785 [Rhodobacteraceae bacterium]|nr:hypothetical protein [Paracoccaceae bacterium]